MKRLRGLALAVLMFAVAASAAEPPAVKLDPAGVSPRALEEQTERSLARDYGRAWQTLVQALATADASPLDEYFVGFAREKLEQAVRDQQRTGVRVRYLDRGHQLQALFYSPEGSSIQLRDTAQLEMQVFDGDQLVYIKQLIVPYLVVMTPAEDRWKVRVLESMPD